jgi:predicted transcriptional regulator
MKNYTQLKRRLLKDKKTKKAYDESESEFDFIRMLIRKRTEKGLSQEELARKIGTRQSAISRLESGRYNPTLKALQKIAQALDAKIKISIH